MPKQKLIGVALEKKESIISRCCDNIKIENLRDFFANEASLAAWDRLAPMLISNAEEKVAFDKIEAIKAKVLQEINRQKTSLASPMKRIRK